MAALSVKDAFFPFRPEHGSKGTPIVLWANYFKMNPVAKSMYKYDLRVTAKRLTKEQDEAAKEKTKGKGPERQPQTGDEQQGPKEAKGKKLAKIIEAALVNLKKAVVATEYKQQLVALEKLQLPADAIMQVDLAEPGRNTETWFVRFDGPTSIDLGGLMNYLQTLEDPANDSVFPKYPSEIDALGVVLGHTPRSNPNTAAVGRNRFFAVDKTRKDAATRLPDGNLLDILRGYVQSVRPATGRLLLNTNVTHGVFRKEFSLAALFEFQGLTKLENPNSISGPEKAALQRLHKFLGRSRIRCHVPGDKPGEFLTTERTMAGLATSSDGKKDEPRPKFLHPQCPYACASTVKFFLRPPKDAATAHPKLTYGDHIIVANYYQLRYNIKAKPGLPLINVGTQGKPIYILPELCTLLPGQPMKTKLSAAEADAMIQFACRPPPANAESITTSARALLALDNNKLLKDFGITVDKELITVRGRELPPPVVNYKAGSSVQSVTPQDGSWLMKGVRVWAPGRRIANWTYLTIGNGPHEVIKTTVTGFAKFLDGDMGIQMNRQPSPATGHRAQDKSEEALRNAFSKIASQKPRPEFVLVVLPDKDTTRYNVVKKLADVEFGLTTVCVRQELLLKNQGQLGYFANVGLKVNLKFGGANHQVKDGTGLVATTMFAGYDVTHPTNLASGAGENAPSLVGLVASIDSNLAQWPAVAWENKSRGEEVENVDGQFVHHFKNRIKLWQNQNGGKLPENIVIFRDGVSEGQFKMVLDKELPHIRQACKEMYPVKSNGPLISLIVSVKRHQTRFYPTDPNHIHSRSKSPKEGTIVDRGVTNVRCWDFFLQAHASLQGTARPAHYTVLLDEIFRSKFGSDAANKLEQLTHDMCYAYGRATKAVSICPPAYYADLVCTRARAHKIELFEDVRSISSNERQAIGQRSVHDSLKNSMYYI